MLNELALSLFWFLLLVLFFTATPAWAHQASSIGLMSQHHDVEQTQSRYTLIDLLVFTASVAFAIAIFRYRDLKTAALYGPLMVIPPLTPLIICNSAITRCNRLSIWSWRKRLLYVGLVFPAMSLSVATIIAAIPLGLMALQGLVDTNTYTLRVSRYTLLLVGTGLVFASLAIPIVRFLLRRFFGFVTGGG